MSNDGVWLDQIPYEPPLVACLFCGDPLGPFEVMQVVIRGEVVKPLCSICFDVAEATPHRFGEQVE